VKRGQILLLSGPSGSGKSTLLSRLFGEFDNLYFSISSTTREPRAGERDGVDYFFVSKDEFKKGIDEGQFLEWAQVHANYYGTSLRPVEVALEAGKVVVFDIDVQGFNLARKCYGELITSVFVTTKNRTILKERLEARGSDTAETIEKRLFNAAFELGHLDEYDYLIINENLNESYEKLRAIFLAMKCEVSGFELGAVCDAWSDA